MPLFRMEFESLRPNKLVTLNRPADEAEQAIAWAKKRFSIRRDSLRAFPVHEKDASAIQELEKHLKRPIAEPFVCWEDGRVVGLDLGMAVCDLKR